MGYEWTGGRTPQSLTIAGIYDDLSIFHILYTVYTLYIYTHYILYIFTYMYIYTYMIIIYIYTYTPKNHLNHFFQEQYIIYSVVEKINVVFWMIYFDLWTCLCFCVCVSVFVCVCQVWVCVCVSMFLQSCQINGNLGAFVLWCSISFRYPMEIIIYGDHH